MLEPEKKNSAHYFLKKINHSEINIYINFRVILHMLIPDEIQY